MSDVKKVFPTCGDSRRCFAKFQDNPADKFHKCSVLTETYQDGKCPFAKPARGVTNGKYYPHRDYT